MSKTNKDEIILNALLTSFTVKEAAETAGISEGTIYNYLKRPEFVQKYNEARGTIIAHATATLQAYSTKAVEEIIALIDDFSINEQTRLNACRTILEYCLKFTEVHDFAQRLQEIERNITNN